MSKKFIRQETARHLKLGKRRKKGRKWRRPKGRHSKMRLKRKSYPSSPIIGRKSSMKNLRKVEGLTPVIIHNIKELEFLGRNSAGILAKVGAKKKLEIIKLARDKNIKLLNVREAK